MSNATKWTNNDKCLKKKCTKLSNSMVKNNDIIPFYYYKMKTQDTNELYNNNYININLSVDIILLPTWLYVSLITNRQVVFTLAHSHRHFL